MLWALIPRSLSKLSAIIYSSLEINLCRKRFLCWSLRSIPCNNYVNSLYRNIMTTKKDGGLGVGMGRPSPLEMRAPEKLVVLSWQRSTLWKGQCHSHVHSGLQSYLCLKWVRRQACQLGGYHSIVRKRWRWERLNCFKFSIYLICVFPLRL